MEADASADRMTRAPQQERGQRRVAQILEAAAEVFREHGVGGATMQLIAERAGASMGSLYHFFPNKDAVLETLGARYADRIRRRNEEAMPLSLAHLEPNALFDAVLCAQMAFIEETPAFEAVHAAVARHCPAIYDALNQALVGHVGQFLALRYPRMPEPQRLASAMVSVSIVRTVVNLAAQAPAAMRALVIGEGHAMLVAHYGAADAQFGVGHSSSRDVRAPRPSIPVP
ncbi:MAG: TetR/AcrR family transcriptional regulator [Gemmatimonas sp.]|jgi:AcrR family transcriptional regulator|uniref:TetR/AcrR family transcriptional regulator n=1 Tax=Gemmatimonas sp. TaxID=1962908 RepID=UPI00391F9EDC|nr:TetR/AcrR family transcriptional regulator [Gemmatimonadota bacterium]